MFQISRKSVKNTDIGVKKKMCENLKLPRACAVKISWVTKVIYWKSPFQIWCRSDALRKTIRGMDIFIH